MKMEMEKLNDNDDYNVNEGGTKWWVKNGLLHRENDKPAVVWADGTKFYYQNGVPHRDGGKPTMEYPTRKKTPSTYRIKEWCNNQGKLHHPDNDVPAILFSDGSKIYCKNGKFHRENNKPAIERAGGNNHYFIDGVEYFPEV